MKSCLLLLAFMTFNSLVYTNAAELSREALNNAGQGYIGNKVIEFFATAQPILKDPYCMTRIFKTSEHKFLDGQGLKISSVSISSAKAWDNDSAEFVEISAFYKKLNSSSNFAKGVVTVSCEIKDKL